MARGDRVVRFPLWPDIKCYRKEEATRFNASGAIRALEAIGRHLGKLDSSDKEQDVHALFIAGVRNFIRSGAPLPKDR